MTVLVQGDTPDVCIIGAGLVGGLMAYELSRRGLRVVILEAGKRYEISERMAYMQEAVSGGLSDRWPYSSDFPERDVYSDVGEVSYPVNNLRVKAVGGSTLHWGGQTLRFLESDFRLKSLYGIADDWPITYDELEPYYTKAEKALGVAGAADSPFASWRSEDFPLPPFPHSVGDKIFKTACDRMGITMHGIPWARNSIPYHNRPACAAYATCGTYRICPIAAQYTSENHIRLAEESGKVIVIPGANVIRLVTNKEKVVTGAIYMHRDKKEAEQKARLFVVAAHTVESARLLLLSESSLFPDGLVNGSGMVGKNFMERPAVAVHGIHRLKTLPYRIGFPTAESLQFCNPKDRNKTAATKYEFHNFGGPTPARIAGASGNWGDALAEEVQNSFGHHMSVEASIEQLPDSSNTVSLDPDLKDFFENPAPRIEYSYNEYEKSAIETAIQLAREILMAAEVDSIEDDIDLGFAGHPMGTCRMGSDPETSVVDPNLRAHEIPNLFIVGGGVFVTGSSLQPSLTIAALAIRAAEYIASHGVR